MPKFEFKAFTPEGKLKEGVLKAENREQALKILQEQNLLVTYLTEEKKRPIFFQKPGLKDVYLFTRQLAYLISAQTPLGEAIKTLSESAPNKSFRDILIEIYNEIIGGVQFSLALSRFPDIFDSYYIGMVKIGESAGALDETLLYIANHLEAQIKSRNRIIQALIYPAIVVAIFLVVMFTLFYYVIPQIANIFVENNIPIPSVTKFFQDIANFIKNFGLFLIVILIALVYYAFEYFKTREGRVFFLNLVEEMPVFGPLLRNIYVSQFLESLQYLIRGGVPLVEALDIIKNTINHPAYESAINYTIEEIKKGKPLSELLSEFPNLFHPIVITAFKTAEKTGQLSYITFTILRYYDETIEAQINNLSEALQPILIIVLAFALGFLELSLLIPLLNLTKYVQNF